MILRMISQSNYGNQDEIVSFELSTDFDFSAELEKESTQPQPMKM